mgnify:FL=1|jgi:GNAT superfamily N-acetyltransferase
MSKVALKDGRKIEITQLDFSQLEELVSQDLPTCDINGHDRSFEGFRYLGPHNTLDMEWLFEENKYEEETKLTPLEDNARPLQNKEFYHRALAAYDDDQLAGILICQWNKGRNDFWTYHIKFIDVHEDYKNLGVGTHLTKALDQANFLKGHILKRGISSDQGKAYIAHVMDRELKAKDYAVIPPRYGSMIAPISPGIYDTYGKKIRTKEPNQQLPKKTKPWLEKLISLFR